MSLETWLAFLGASALLVMLPGPTILTVISYSLTHGKRARLPLVLAVALGDSTALVLSLLGLGALLAASAFWFTVVKTVGGLYLLYLGYRLLRAGVSPATLPAAKPVGSRWKLFANTYLVTALNPKGMIFFVAFLPQFIDPARSLLLQFAVMAGTFAAIEIATEMLIAGMAHRISPWLARVGKRFNRACGGVFVAIGAALPLRG